MSLYETEDIHVESEATAASEHARLTIWCACGTWCAAQFRRSPWGPWCLWTGFKHLFRALGSTENHISGARNSGI